MAELYDLSMLEGITMLDLLSALYDWDAFRFALWHTFEALGYGDAIRTLIESVGFVVWDDYSITEAAS